MFIGVLPAHCRTRQVVLLYDERTTLPGLAAIDASIARTLTSSSAEPIEVYRESMDLSRFGSAPYLLILQDYLRKKYADKKIDVVVAVMSPALDFLLTHENVVFPGTPIVFCGIDSRELGGRALPSRVTGVLLKRAFAPTLDIALTLHPRTKRVVFVAGTSEFDSRLLEQAREELLPYKDRLDFTYLTALPMRDLLSQVSKLPPYTIVLYSTLFKDGEGAPSEPYDVAEHLAAASNAPVYGFSDQYLGRGIVGGRMYYTLSAHGEVAAGLVLKIFAGIPPSTIPVVEPEASVTLFDWRQLQRWGIRESKLPQGSTVLFRQLSFWDKYKLYVVGVAAILTLQAVIIGGLLLQRKRRRRAEEALRASEEWLRLGQQIAYIGSFEWNIRTGVTTWTSELEAMYGLPPGGFSRTQTAFENLIHADDRAGVIKLVGHALKTGQPTEGEWRVVWPDGSVHWIAGRWQVLMNESGEASRVIGVNMDVTTRRTAEQAFQQMNRALEERTSLLQSREALLQIFVKHVPAAVAMLDRDMCYLQVSERWCADYSLDGSEILGRSHYEIFPDIPDQWKQVHRRALAGETVRAEEDPWDREGGTTWLRWEIRPWQNQDGVQGGILIFTEDITHRKNAEEELSGMTRKLIEAHEQERTRIARELHDDVVQQLALLSLELEGVQEDVPDVASELRTRIGALVNQTAEIVDDVQSLSHELHSSKLEYLGIVGAAKNFCKELGERQKLEIDFQSHDLPTTLPNELCVSLFRVLQEAVRNAAKHSGVKHFEVRLWGRTGEVHLTVSDLGAGFDTETAMKSTGLGLTSMQERLRLVGGELSINSQPKSGTTIHARVPFRSTSDSARAAG